MRGRSLVTLLVLILALPSGVGLVNTLLPAFGIAPALGHHAFGFAAFHRLVAEPGLWRGAMVGTAAGISSTLLALLAAHLILFHIHQSRREALVGRLLAPLLAMPHASFAVGFAFLFAPSGLLLRLLSPWATGVTRPPDWLFPNDPYGFALTLGLALRETPFLLFSGLAALARIPVDAHLAVARALGHDEARAWSLAVLPQLQRALRLPTFAVLAYGCSAVDMALVLGPTNPPTLAVTLTRLALDPKLDMRLVAAAGALLQLGLVFGAGLGLLLLERLVFTAFFSTRRRSERRGPVRLLRHAGGLAFCGLCAVGYLVILTLILWSLAGSWRFPALLPETLDLGHWRRAWPQLASAIIDTLLLAAAVSGVAVALALHLLRRPDATGRYGAAPPGLALLYLPLLLPQLAFLPGLQLLLLSAAADGTWIGVAFAHGVVVLPYVLLMLTGPLAATPVTYGEVARCLGAGRLAAFFRAEWPLLLRPLLAAFAVGASVSISLYLPTLLVGAGRVSTLATETVALTMAGDRRLAAIAGLWLALLPLLFFLLPFLWPDRLCSARRRAGSRHREHVSGGLGEARSLR